MPVTVHDPNCPGLTQKPQRSSALCLDSDVFDGYVMTLWISGRLKSVALRHTGFWTQQFIADTKSIAPYLWNASTIKMVLFSMS